MLLPIKKQILSGLLALLPLALIAQTPCDTGRFASDVFANVTVTSGVNFGQNIDFIGNNTILNMDIYEPTGDVMVARPLIIWAHGGSFIGGSKTDPDVVALADAFAKKGFVCASIDYRVGMWPIDSVNAVKAVVRAFQDMKAATRFFYQDAATSNTYRIDTTRIYVGGSSAGAITAVHLAYLDQECEVEPYISISELNTMGGIEGTSGNPGYSSDVAGAINLSGALASYGWMEAGDVPVCSLHGNVDGTVPYNRGVASVSGFSVIWMDGSRMIHEQAMAVGVTSKLYTHYGANHAPYVSSSAYMDTTINFVRDFLVEQLGCSETPLQPANSPLENANLYQLFYCGLEVDELKEAGFSVYPNPTDHNLTIATSLEKDFNLAIYSTTGELVYNKNLSGLSNQLDISNWSSGIYLGVISSETEVIQFKLVRE